MKKLNSLFSYKNNERMNFSSKQARSEILFDSGVKCDDKL